jgi:predicted RNase H-like HicB family nuclease
MKLTVAFKEEGDWIAAWIVEMPNVVSQGKTLEEATENLRDAYQMMVNLYREEAESQGFKTEELVFV